MDRRPAETATKHNEACTMAFGRPSKVAGVCARCDELRAGAEPRKGYGSSRASTIRSVARRAIWKHVA